MGRKNVVPCAVIVNMLTFMSSSNGSLDDGRRRTIVNKEGTENCNCKKEQMEGKEPILVIYQGERGAQIIRKHMCKQLGSNNVHIFFSNNNVHILLTHVKILKILSSNPLCSLRNLLGRLSEGQIFILSII